MQVQKKLILIRHAHRDTEIHSLDNGLSAKGHKQVKQLIQFASKNFEKYNLETAHFITSPKKRCVETITPLAEKFGTKVVIEPMLGEGDYHDRMNAFIDYWKNKAPELVVACSHGDYIPSLVQKLTGGMIIIKKSGWCEIELVGRDCYLTWLVQKYE